MRWIMARLFGVGEENRFVSFFKDFLVAASPGIAAGAVVVFLIVKLVDPAPPRKLVISGGPDNTYNQVFAKLYAESLKEEGVDVEVRSSSGYAENLSRLGDPRSDVEVAFVQDGLGDPNSSPGLESLGSLYYEPLWVFTRVSGLNRLSQLEGKRIAVGVTGSGTQALATTVLANSGVGKDNSSFFTLDSEGAVAALKKGEVDAAFFLGIHLDPVIDQRLADSSLQLMNFDQAEGTVRVLPFLHHLILPHGAISLKRNIPAQDTHLVASTATLIARRSLHPALTYLLLKAAQKIHSAPGLFEAKDEFPRNKSFWFPLNNEAKSFYKNGTPFWHRFLPFWLATLVGRFIFFVVPILVLIYPLLKLIPQIYTWRLRSRIFRYYGELKFFELQINPKASYADYCAYLERLDDIERRVNQLKLPLDYTEHIYVLREHIDFVRGRLGRVLAGIKEPPTTPPPG